MVLKFSGAPLGGDVRQVGPDRGLSTPSGRVVPEFQVEYLREVLGQGFRIMYEVFPDRIEVFSVVSSRQQLVPDDEPTRDD